MSRSNSSSESSNKLKLVRCEKESGSVNLPVIKVVPLHKIKKMNSQFSDKKAKLNSIVFLSKSF